MLRHLHLRVFLGRSLLIVSNLIHPESRSPLGFALRSLSLSLFPLAALASGEVHHACLPFRRRGPAGFRRRGPQGVVEIGFGFELLKVAAYRRRFVSSYILAVCDRHDQGQACWMIPQAILDGPGDEPVEAAVMKLGQLAPGSGIKRGAFALAVLGQEREGVGSAGQGGGVYLPGGAMVAC